MNLLDRRNFLRLAPGAVAFSAVPLTARADAYPSRPVRLFVGFPPGSGADVDARLISQWLSERLGQQFAIENRPGAGTNIATEAVVRAAPDGYSLLYVTAANAVNATLYDNLSYNFIRDIAPVAGTVRASFVLIVSPKLPVTTVPEFIAYAKANPGKINMASPGTGTVVHMAGELFKSMAGVDLVHVPYRGDFYADLIGGQVQVVFSPMASAIGYIKSGALRPLAVLSAKRSALLPDLPTVAEYVPGYEAGAWDGIGAPKETPSEIINKLNGAINTILADPKLQARLAELGLVPMPMTAAEFGQFIVGETEKWAKVVKFAGIKVQ